MVPMSLVGTLVDLKVRYQLFGAENGKMCRKMGQKGAFSGVFKLELVSTK